MIWATGQQLQNGKYVIEEVLGQGGFGITYKALHVPLEQQVVIKTPNEYLKYERDYDQYVERFVREGRILARLSETPHPQIVGVRDLFQDGETHCLVMDFVPGMNLFDAVKQRGGLPEGEAIGYIRQIGEALALVHQAGLVHRDAHPRNIMLRDNGTAVLIDFGIAKEIIPSTISSTGNAGNQGFAPYEQLVRGSREPTVDIYCLAATLYYAITGQRPPTSLDRKLNDIPVIPPKQLVPEISDRINQAILHGMALEAENRPQSIEDWLKYLELEVDLISHQPELSTKVLPGLKLFNYTKPKRLILLFIAIPICLVGWQLFPRMEKLFKASRILYPPQLPLNGDIVDGVLNSEDKSDNPLDRKYSDAYVFQGRRGQEVTIEMSSKEFDPSLILLAPDGSKLDVNDDISPNDFNARIVTRLPDNGTYTAIAQSHEAGESGHYSLRVVAR